MEMLLTPLYFQERILTSSHSPPSLPHFITLVLTFGRNRSWYVGFARRVRDFFIGKVTFFRPERIISVHKQISYPNPTDEQCHMHLRKIKSTLRSHVQSFSFMNIFEGMLQDKIHIDSCMPQF